jgi:methionyl-tRNA formyltransferase
MTGPIWFMGSGFFGVRCLEELCSVEIPQLVVTNPPRKAGRGLAERVTAVEALAASRGIEVHRSANINEDEVLKGRLAGGTPEVIFVIDFGQKVLDPFLSTPPYGCINIHPSLLPLYRGAAPLQRAIMNGETQTGVSAFRLVEAMDAGPILATEHLEIALSDTYGNLLERCSKKAGHLFREVLGLIEGDGLTGRDQDSDRATYAPKISKEEARIDWTRSAREVHDHIRALNPAPGAYTFMGGRRVKIWESSPSAESGKPGVLLGDHEGSPIVGCGKGSLVLLRVQPEGKKALEGRSWLRGLKIGKGEALFEQS